MPKRRRILSILTTEKRGILGKMNWIVSHDAGGAELISSWVKARSAETYQFILEGPAKQVFQRKLGSVQMPGRKEFLSSVKHGDFVLTGTGWASDLEKVARAKAREMGAFTVAFLDHWANYRMRFTVGTDILLPDEIWVADAYALELAQNEFPGANVKQVRNDYLEEIKTEISDLQKNPRFERDGEGMHILYVCEAITERVGRPKTGDLPEQMALERFLAWMNALSPRPTVAKILLRPHPAEGIEKYNLIMQKYANLPWVVGPWGTLSEECAWADWIVGMGSMALVVAAYAGKRTISCMPRADQKNALPYKEIERI